MFSIGDKCRDNQLFFTFKKGTCPPSSNKDVPVIVEQVLNFNVRPHAKKLEAAISEFKKDPSESALQACCQARQTLMSDLKILVESLFPTIAVEFKVQEALRIRSIEVILNARQEARFDRIKQELIKKSQAFSEYSASFCEELVKKDGEVEGKKEAKVVTLALNSLPYLKINDYNRIIKIVEAFIEAYSFISNKISVEILNEIEAEARK